MDMSLQLTAASEQQLRRLALKLSTAGERFPVVQRSRLGHAALLLREPVTDIMKAEAPRRTGTLADSLQATVRPLPEGGAALTWTADGVSYARYVTEGTGIYHKPDAHTAWTIVPRAKRALSWSGAAHPVGRVTMRGQKPNLFPARTRVRALPLVREVLALAGRQIGHELIGNDTVTGGLP